MKVLVLSALIALGVAAPHMALADSQDEIEFAAGLEETLGHFWALEQNLDEGNAELALIHATHPIAELYDALKPTLAESDPDLDARMQATLLDLKDRATTDVSRAQAQAAIDDAKGIVESARSAVVGDDLSGDPNFKLELMKTLLETSIAEYGEAVSDGIIENVAEFQDGSAFVWRSQQILDEIRSDIDSDEVAEMDELYEELWAAYDERADPSDVETIAGGILGEINGILGVEDGETDLLEYVENINDLLADARSEYGQGNADNALSLVTRAYLNNYEFLEGPLIEAGERELMTQIELMMREDLREMIRSGAPVSEVNLQIDAILDRMNVVASIVPEFGTVAMIVLAVAIASIVALAARSRVPMIRP